MSFTPATLDVLGIPISYESIVLSVITGGLLYVPIRYATPAGFYIVKKLFAYMTETRMRAKTPRIAHNKLAGGNPQGPPGTGGGTGLPGGGGGSGLGGGSVGGSGGGVGVGGGGSS